MLLDLLLIITGLAGLLFGGDMLIRGASALAKDFGVSEIVIGLTVVAFGTSAPELSVNVIAAVQDNSAISFGNIIGSNIANIGLILGISALIRPLAIEGIIVSREIPMMILASILILVVGSDLVLRDSANMFDRSDGLILLLIFCVFLFYTIGDVIKKRKSDPLIQQVQEFEDAKFSESTLFNSLLFLAGLTLLVIGGKVAVDAAIEIAEALDVPQVIIGLTIIAIGTSLPELVTSGIATWKGNTDIAIGNVVGSNIFNLLLVNGICATIRPIPVPQMGGSADLAMMVFLAVLLVPVGVIASKRIQRWEGALLLLIFISFTTWRVTSVT
ncbi:MAG: calcium/sodium antiporter [Gammaproteobacteria bacterium]|nr:calcium/sodium antiporter [Gammaproteobacteria bacterium]